MLCNSILSVSDIRIRNGYKDIFKLRCSEFFLCVGHYVYLDFHCWILLRQSDKTKESKKTENIGNFKLHPPLYQSIGYLWQASTTPHAEKLVRQVGRQFTENDLKWNNRILRRHLSNYLNSKRHFTTRWYGTKNISTHIGFMIWSGNEAVSSDKQCLKETSASVDTHRLEQGYESKVQRNPFIIPSLPFLSTFLLEDRLPAMTELKAVF